MGIFCIIQHPNNFVNETSEKPSFSAGKFIKKRKILQKSNNYTIKMHKYTPACSCRSALFR